MTLILSCVTADHAIQVSDRKVTYSDGSTKTDEANKATLFAGEVAFAHTGPAELGPGMPTDDKPHTDFWFAQLIAQYPSIPSNSLAKLLESIGTSVSAELLKLPAKHRAIAFVGVGWGRVSSNPSHYFPAIVSLSNCLGARGNWLPTITDTLQSEYTTLGPSDRGYILMSAGQQLTYQERVDLDRSIRRSVKQGRPSSTIAQLMAQAIDRVANRNQTVGHDLMVMIIPRAAVPVSSIGTGPPQDDQATFAYLRSQDAEESTYFMPNTAAPGACLIGGVLGIGKSPIT